MSKDHTMIEYHVRYTLVISSYDDRWTESYPSPEEAEARASDHMRNGYDVEPGVGVYQYVEQDGMTLIDWIADVSTLAIAKQMVDLLNPPVGEADNDNNQIWERINV